MIDHLVHPWMPNESHRREDELAWKLAELAAEEIPTDDAAAEMAALRIIDDWAVAVAALDRPSVIAAQSTARAYTRDTGARLIGHGDNLRVDSYWAAYANASAIRELDFNDSFFANDSSHPGDVIGPLVAIAEAQRVSHRALLRGIVTAYEVQVNLVKGITLNQYRIDHVAHLAPAVTAGLGAMLRLDTSVIYQAINLSVQLSVSTRQTRKGQISSYKANAPGHIGQLAIYAMDRAMRGETSPAPVYEGDYGILAILLGGPDCECVVPLPAAGEPRTAILETYPKEHSAGYHGQALIDLAFKLRGRVGKFDNIRDISIHTKALTHLVMGSGANDPQKWQPSASRETLDHSAMYIFAVALQDGVWHHKQSYTTERVNRSDTVALWQKVKTVEDPEWSAAFEKPAPLDKAQGAKVVITYKDGTTLEDELRVANAHPRGATPWETEQYCTKFKQLADSLIKPKEIDRFLNYALSIPEDHDSTVNLSIEAVRSAASSEKPGLLN